MSPDGTGTGAAGVVGRSSTTARAVSQVAAQGDRHRVPRPLQARCHTGIGRSGARTAWRSARSGVLTSVEDARPRRPPTRPRCCSPFHNVADGVVSIVGNARRGPTFGCYLADARRSRAGGPTLASPIAECPLLAAVGPTIASPIAEGLLLAAIRPGLTPQMAEGPLSAAVGSTPGASPRARVSPPGQPRCPRTEPAPARPAWWAGLPPRRGR